MHRRDSAEEEVQEVWEFRVRPVCAVTRVPLSVG